MLLKCSVFFLAVLVPSLSSGDDAGRPLILAHYMPWYSAEPVSGQWGWHWTMNHFDPAKTVDGRRQIAAKFYPLIGPYDSGDNDVIEYHLLTMKAAGIDGVIVDWYGMTDFRDYAVLHTNTTRVLQQCERLRMKFVICYEDQTVPALVEANRLGFGDRVGHVTAEIQWLQKYWFKSPSYLRFGKYPVMLSFGHAGLSDKEWQTCLAALESPIHYYSQDYLRVGANGVFDWPNPKTGIVRVNQFINEAKNWPDAVPVVYPRFNDIYQEAKVSDGYPIVPDRDGETFAKTLSKALKMKPRLIQIATWNDWGEGTQIEPSSEFGYRDLENLQRVLRDIDDGNVKASPMSLQLPVEVLNLRREGVVDSEKIDQIVERMTRENFVGAASLLQSIR